jgi:acyl-CoA thioester hydrolase
MKKFRHKIRIRVRNFEVDWQGIVHNSVYLQYFETGRIEYLRKIGYVLDLVSVNRDSRVVLARNEVDYLLPAVFDDMLEVNTKVSMFGTTSFVFEGVIRNIETGKLIARNRAVHVWLHPRKGVPRKLPPAFVAGVERFEGSPIPRKMQ